ncbi:PilZ domain-containing protein [Henriciella mobilis]|uniref:PilZ domain-containing protein n=1 Tax=Henriciella mobilis TaxID=2305467 RepID=UPI000E6657F1|nr:PilZ domain-containing protein [Henriciella mobilis]RIJ15309.1 PilZ domain-containing protein [Henriciella mobilis]RIJ18774.1 PilZ domain-containing protein [Henriciella mobilis]
MASATNKKFGTIAAKPAADNAGQDDMSENREHPRFDVNTNGTLVLETGFKIPFVVKDMSQRGAKLLLQHSVVLPARFTVEIVSPDNRKIKRCKASRQWQRGPLVGVRLLSSQTINL